MGKQPRRGPHGAFQPTDEHRKNVKILAALGIPETQICAIVREQADWQKLPAQAARREDDTRRCAGFTPASRKTAPTSPATSLRRAIGAKWCVMEVEKRGTWLKDSRWHFSDIPDGRNTLRREIAAAIEEAKKTAA